jgi:hypothetical protein
MQVLNIEGRRPNYEVCSQHTYCSSNAQLPVCKEPEIGSVGCKICKISADYSLEYLHISQWLLFTTSTHKVFLSNLYRRIPVIKNDIGR